MFVAGVMLGFVLAVVFVLALVALFGWLEGRAPMTVPPKPESPPQAPPAPSRIGAAYDRQRGHNRMMGN